MKPDGSLDDLDFAAVANFLNKPPSAESIGAIMSGRAAEDGEVDPPQPPVTYRAGSALLRIPEDKEQYDSVMQRVMDGKTIIRQDLHHFDGAGNLRLWLTWLDVVEGKPEPKT